LPGRLGAGRAEEEEAILGCGTPAAQRCHGSNAEDHAGARKHRPRWALAKEDGHFWLLLMR